MKKKTSPILTTGLTRSTNERKDSQHQSNWELSLEGTKFPLYTAEADFFEECRKTGQAALGLLFVNYWPTCGRIYDSKLAGVEGRLLCSTCLIDMGISFEMSLPSFMYGGNMLFINGEQPSNLFDSAKAAKCYFCGSESGILLWDHQKYGEITEQDMEALRDLWRNRSKLWWMQNDRSFGMCDICSSSVIPRGHGYHRDSDMICEECCLSATNTRALSELRKDPDYFGKSELRRARNLKSGKWRFERGIIQRVNLY